LASSTCSWSSAPKSSRSGRYALRRLIEQHGRDGTVLDWLGALAADCPRKRAAHPPTMRGHVVMGTLRRSVLLCREPGKQTLQCRDRSS